ncbi:MAG: hypothetical protein K5683_08180 [Prevotella sp.]|nr:hypothetical protein [Prevotella sp.]
MGKRNVYKVADHFFAVGASEQMLSQLSQYAPFEVAVDEADVDCVFCLDVAGNDDFPQVELTKETEQDDEGSQILAGYADDGRSYFEFMLWGKRSARMLVTDNKKGIVWLESNWLFGLNNGLMVLFALATANRKTALFHSSVVSYQGHGYMFLGQSGTGKSTHSSLWLKYIPGTELVNDDNPVVRVMDDGEIRVFGSPWSGKTPCYRNISYTLGAIVRLSQAPYNKIYPLRAIEAYAALVPSISGKRWDKAQAEGLHETENLLAQYARMWHLECLPDEDAARLCCKTVSYDRQ